MRPIFCIGKSNGNLAVVVIRGYMFSKRMVNNLIAEGRYLDATHLVSDVTAVCSRQRKLVYAYIIVRHVCVMCTTCVADISQQLYHDPDDFAGSNEKVTNHTYIDYTLVK